LTQYKNVLFRRATPFLQELKFERAASQ
jgi:hypothetical protein